MRAYTRTDFTVLPEIRVLYDRLTEIDFGHSFAMEHHEGGDALPDHLSAVRAPHCSLQADGVVCEEKHPTKEELSVTTQYRLASAALATNEHIPIVPRSACRAAHALHGEVASETGPVGKCKL